MATVTSFPPIARRDAVVLILGSMPGRESLAQGQYYAHRQNAFWPIMGQLFGAGEGVRYTQRKRTLRDHRVAVWDVLRTCFRPGSMDAAICVASEVPNDFTAFFHRCRHIKALFFNGRKAETAFRRHVLPSLATTLDGTVLVTLPSTSPAYASLSRNEKLEQWKCILDYTVQ